MKLKIGLVGFGYWGHHYARLVNEHIDCKLESVCDLNEDNLLQIAQKYPNTKVTKNIDDIIHSNINAVIVCTPVTTHYNIVKDLLKAGKNVMCEKVFTETSEQALELMELADENELKLLVCHTFIYNSCYQYIKKLIEQNELGDIYYVNMTRLGNSPKRMDINAIGDLAVHDFAMLIDLFGMPKCVSAFGNSYLRDGLEDIGVVNMKFENNVIATTTVSWLNPVKERKMTIVGSEKMVVFDDIKKSVIVYDKELQQPQPIEYKQPLEEQLNDFVDCIINDKEPIVGAFEGYQVVKVLESCNKSLKQ